MAADAATAVLTQVGKGRTETSTRLTASKDGIGHR